MVVVVAPLCEMVGKFEAREVGASIFEINDNQLFVLILWMQQWGFARRPQSQQIPILRLQLLA